MSKYLIMKCDELSDQFECDADRTPIAFTDNWEDWFYSNNPNFSFEVWKFENDEFELVKDYETRMNRGMVLVWYTEDSEEGEFNVEKRYPDISRDDDVPKEVLERYEKGDDQEFSLFYCGYISWVEDDIYYAYTEYADHIIYSPY